MRKTILFLIVNLLFIIVNCAQEVNCNWSKRFGGYGGDAASSIADANGNTYSVGTFFEGASFSNNGNVGSVSGDGYNVFVSKIDSTGNIVWIKSFGGSQNDFGNSISLDENNNVYVTGRFQGTSDFDPGYGYSYLSATNTVSGENSFISKLNSNGDFVWAKKMEVNNYIKVSVINSEEIFITGSFSGSLDFDFGIGTQILTSTGLIDLFILKIDSQSNFIDVKRIGGKYLSYLFLSKIFKSDDGFYYLSGTFVGNIDFDSGLDSFFVASSITGGSDFFILKIDSMLDFKWVKQFSSDNFSSININRFDNSNDLIITGIFQGAVDFDPDSGLALLTPVLRSDIFILKMNSSWKFNWVKRISSSFSDGLITTIDNYNNVYLTGIFSDTLISNLISGNDTLFSNGYRNNFLLKISQNGSFIWQTQIKCITNTSYIVPFSMSTDKINNIFISGAFSGTIKFGNRTNFYLLNSLGASSDVFHSKFSQNDPLKIEFRENGATQISISPNPNSGEFFIQSKLNGEYKIFNQLGKEIRSFTKYETENYLVNLKGISNGIYFLKGKNSEQVVIEKIIIAN